METELQTMIDRCEQARRESTQFVSSQTVEALKFALVNFHLPDIQPPTMVEKLTQIVGECFEDFKKSRPQPVNATAMNYLISALQEIKKNQP